MPFSLVCLPGIEPGTYSVGGCHSIQLRYRHIVVLNCGLRRHRLIRQGVDLGVDFFIVVLFAEKINKKPQDIVEFPQNSLIAY